MNIQVNPKKTLADVQVLAKEVVKKNNIVKSQVVAVFDVSGSMSNMYYSGIVDALATTVLGLGIELDDNGVIPVYALDEDCRRLPDLTKENLANYTRTHLRQIVGGSTDYAPTINRIVKDAEAGDPMLVLLFTDGENFDEEEAEEALINASKLPIFFQWYGIYSVYQPAFSFLHNMDEMEGRQVDNAGFSPLGLSVSEDNTDAHDRTLYEDMIKEYKDFPKKATSAGVTWENLKNSRKKFFGLF